jgi:aminoglycoside phosphotransferase (APT) family kinase protein
VSRPESFSAEVVSRALGCAAVARVEVVETFRGSTAEVARLRIAFSDGRQPLTAIGKTATGQGLAAVRRELRFFAQLAPLWASPAPAFLGSCEHDGGEGARLLLLTEDLEAAGYALPRDGVTPSQLHAVVDTLVSLHARFWEDLQVEILDPAHPTPSVTRAAQAWPADAVRAHAIAVRAAAERFLCDGALAPAERALLGEVLEAWEPHILARAADGRALTLIHADFHLLGNLLFAGDDARPRVIDWSELKPGLGPHDLAYCLLAVPTGDRLGRDLAVLQRYWEGLQAAGVAGYGWELCWWDYRFSVLTNLFQAVFQHSLLWFRRTAAVAAELNCRAVLGGPPPMP